MPSYKVVAPGFDGKLYHPEGRRNMLHRDKPFPSKKGKEQVPSWLERVKDEVVTSDDKITVQELKDQLTEMGVEFKATAKKPELLELLETAKTAAAVEQDQAEIEGATFLAKGNQSPAVENL